jgi:hypothetical protein
MLLTTRCPGETKRPAFHRWFRGKHRTVSSDRKPVPRSGSGRAPDTSSDRPLGSKDAARDDAERSLTSELADALRARIAELDAVACSRVLGSEREHGSKALR